jgi:hypothetical protein
MVPFEELQRTFAVRYPASDPLDLGEGTVVVLPSLSFPTAELRKIVGIGYYEERLLFLLLLLRRPGVKIVYLTSMPVEEAVVDYYLGFLPDPAGARSRLHMLAAGDPAARSLTAKLLDRPELLDRVRELCEGPGGAFVQPFNVTAGEQELAERLGLPLYGPPAALAGLGSKTGRSGRWSSSSTTASPARATPWSTWPASTARCWTRRWCSAPRRSPGRRSRPRSRRAGRSLRSCWTSPGWSPRACSCASCPAGFP